MAFIPSYLAPVIILATVVIARLSVWMVPEVDMKVFGFHIHHAMFGVIALLISLVFTRHPYWVVVIGSIGLGLIIDELSFFTLGDGKDAQYWAWPSLMGTATLVIVAFFFRDQLLLLAQKLFLHST